MLLVRSACILSNTSKHCNQVSYFVKPQTEKCWSYLTEKSTNRKSWRNKQSFHFDFKYFTSIPLVIAGSSLEFYFDDGDEEEDPAKKPNSSFTNQYSVALKWMHTFHEKPDLSDVPNMIVTLIGPLAQRYWGHKSSLSEMEDFTFRDECYEEAKIRSIYPAVGMLSYLLKKYPDKADEWVRQIVDTVDPQYRTYIVLALERADCTKIPYPIDHPTRLRVEQMKRASSARVGTNVGAYFGSGDIHYLENALQCCEKACDDDATFWSTLTYNSFIDCASQPRTKDQLIIMKNSTKNTRVKRVLQKVIEEAKPLDFY